MKKVLKLSGLDCAHCALELEEEIRKIEGILSVNISFVEQLLTVEYVKEENLEKVIEITNNFEEVKVVKMFDGRQVLRIENLDCPVCAEALQSDLQRIKGVCFAQVDYVTQTITVEVTNQEILKKVIKTANKFEEVRVVDGGDDSATNEDRHTKKWIMLGVSAFFFLMGIVFDLLLKNRVTQIFAYAFYGCSYLCVGYSVLISTVKNVCKGRMFDENFLMTVASVGAVALGEIMEGVAVMFLYQLGELLQGLAVGSSRRSVSKLMELKSERAILLTDKGQEEVTPEKLKVGDRVLVKTGEKTPTDGILISEQAILDTKSLTGESELLQIKSGAEILSGSINAGGIYEMKVVRPYADSAVGRILDMVENATAGKAKPEKFIAKFSKYYTPIVCLLALLTAVGAPLISGLIIDGHLYFKDFPRFLQSALTFLVISCPCALVISVPLTYFSGIGVCAKNGILVKGATYLDVAAKTKIIAFDKTGTLTEGNFTIRKTHTNGVSEEKLLSIAAAVEKASAHPIAKAFEEVKTNLKADKISEISGKGLNAFIEGKRILVGSEKLLSEQGVSFVKVDSVYTLVYVAENGEYLGAIEIGDTLRPEAKETLESLKSLGVTRSVMLTGDGEERAKSVAKEVGMYEVKAGLLPDEKFKIAEKLKEEGTLLYVGDGINDAPVMMTSDCSVSMGKLGSAAAVDASDFVLISDNLKGLPKVIRIARKTRSIVGQNIVFSIVMKIAFMALGGIGVLPLWLAVFADVGVMLLAVLNSFRVRF